MRGIKNVSAIAAVLAVSIVAAACASGGSGSSAINSKEYRCEELRSLVAERQALKLRGLLGLQGSVYHSANSCDSTTEEAVPSSWRTQDKFACVAGFRCEEIIGKEDFSGV